MNLKNQPPILVPRAYRAEIEKLTKAALMDIVWDYATRCAGDENTMAELRRTAEVIMFHRRRAAKEPLSIFSP